MLIEIPDEQVQSILFGLKAAPKKNSAVQFFIRRIEKQLWDAEQVSQAINKNDTKRIIELANIVAPGFYRFQVLNYLVENEAEVIHICTVPADEDEAFTQFIAFVCENVLAKTKKEEEHDTGQNKS